MTNIKSIKFYVINDMYLKKQIITRQTKLLFKNMVAKPGNIGILNLFLQVALKKANGIFLGIVS